MILPHLGRWPNIHETAFIAPSADVIGDVVIGSHSSVWFQCVIRGDVNTIRIGSRTNIQDGSVLHVTRQKAPLVIGDEVTIGHRAMLHGCTIGNRVLVGMSSTIMDHAEIGEESMIGAGTLVTKGMKIPPRSLVIGVPGKVARPLNPEEIAYLTKSAENHVGDLVEYKSHVPGPAKLGDNHDDLEQLDDMEDMEIENNNNGEGR
jgi:carbonic anhydrase/acetyltransferase-like protein (isoleucine patch superfamily)